MRSTAALNGALSHRGSVRPSSPAEGPHLQRIILLVALIGVGLLVPQRPGLLLVVIGALACSVTLWVVPRHWLPALSLLSFTLIPIKNVLDGPGVVNPGTAIVLIWAFRIVASPRDERSAVPTHCPALLLAMAGWLVLSVTRVAVHAVPVPAVGGLIVAAGWSLNFLTLVLLPLTLLRREHPSARNLIVSTWLNAAVVLAIFAVVERWVLGSNPLYDWAYHSGTRPLLQVWDTYRATTTLGHPLVNGAFFCVAAVLGYQGWLRSRRRYYLIAAGASVVGTFAAGSRGAMLGAGVGILVATALGASRKPMRMLVVAGLVAAVPFVFPALVNGRGSSEEARDSYTYRHETIATGLSLAASDPVLGTGAGRSDYVKRAAGGVSGNYGLENSWIEMLVSLGIPGFLLVVALFGSIIRSSWRLDNGVVAGLAALLTCAAGFNMIEQQWPALILFGMTGALAVTPEVSEHSANQRESVQR